jgi:hypothetical protein
VSGPLPGSVHDLTAARIWGIIRELAAAGLITLADKAYISAGEHVLTSYRGRGKPESQEAANRAHARLRAPGERAMPSSRPRTSCASFAAAPGRPGASPRPSTSCKPEISLDEKGSLYVSGRELRRGQRSAAGSVAPVINHQPSEQEH